MCRARVRSNQWHTAEVYEDARAAMRQFEKAGEGALVVDAASWAAAHASRMGELSVASDLATRSLLALKSVEDDALRIEIFNRLGIFCISFLDYDRALEQLELLWPPLNDSATWIRSRGSWPTSPTVCCSFTGSGRSPT